MENRTQQKGRSVAEKNTLSSSVHGSGNGQLTPAQERFNEELFGLTVNVPAQGWRKAAQFILSAALFFSFTQEILKTAMEVLAFNVQNPFKEDHRAGVSIW